MNRGEAMDELFKISIDLIKQEKMPSFYMDDWNFNKTTGIRDRTKVCESVFKASMNSTNNGIRLKKVLNFFLEENKKELKYESI